MFQNYLKSTFRSLLKNKLYSGINILGLAVGLAAVMLILLYIRFELSYDNFHEQGDQLYRIGVVTQRGDVPEDDSYVFTPPIGPAMVSEFPEVEQYMRFSTPREAYLSYEKESFRLDALQYADSTLFELFSFNLLAGDATTALKAPYSLVLTEKMSRQIFDRENPIGKVVVLEDNHQYEVKGIVADPPENSHLQFNALVSFSSLFQNPDLHLGWDGGNQYITYIKLAQHARAEDLAAKFPAFMWPHINQKYADFGIALQPYLQPMQKIHLYFNSYSNNLRSNLYIFGAVGLLILIIACVNFINLTTARASRRAKEVGVRKVIGAGRVDLIRQFLGESFLITGISFALALLLVTRLSPLYRQVMEKNLSLSGLTDLPTVGILLLLFFSVGLIAGSYPAFYLSSLKILTTIKGPFQKRGRLNLNLRNILVVFQFAISAILIISTFFITRQLNFLENKELGFDKEQLMVIPLAGQDAGMEIDNLKQAFAQLSQIIHVSAISEIPGKGFTQNGYLPEGMEKPIMIHVADVDAQFLETFGLELSQGRFFDPARPADQSGYLVNEALVKALHWEEPLGKTISRDGEHRVIGVVKDFNFAPLYADIQPLILTNAPWMERFNYLSLKIAPGNLPATVNEVKKTWDSVLPNAPFDFYFLDDTINQVYRTEMQFRTMFLYFSFLSILIALLGIWGLASFSIEQRVKEVGIRKVLGATIPGLIGLLSGEFLLLIAWALLIAFPLTWYAMRHWLENFAYHTQLSWWIFLLGGSMILTIAWLTVSVKAMKTARTNPVAALKQE
ncbi:MAG: ABC transporter permease [Saprospiraceae bacterium]|nr:ABC transporter permease [Lewinella sp.]